MDEEEDDEEEDDEEEDDEEEEEEEEERVESGDEHVDDAEEEQQMDLSDGEEEGRRGGVGREEGEDMLNEKDVAYIEGIFDRLFSEDKPVQRHNVFSLTNDLLLEGRRRKRALRELPMFLCKIEKVMNLRGHNGCVNTLSFNADGSLLASGSDDRTVALWRSDFSFARKIHPGHTANVFCAQFRTGGREVVSCDRVRTSLECCAVLNI